MSKGFPELTTDEIFNVLFHGKKPKGGYTVQDHADEYFRRSLMVEPWSYDLADAMIEEDVIRHRCGLGDKED